MKLTVAQTVKKFPYPPANLHGVTTQNVVIDLI